MRAPLYSIILTLRHLLTYIQTIENIQLQCGELFLLSGWLKVPSFICLSTLYFRTVFNIESRNCDFGETWSSSKFSSFCYHFRKRKLKKFCWRFSFCCVVFFDIICRIKNFLLSRIFVLQVCWLDVDKY